MAVTCPVCNKEFSKTSNLNRHKREQHKICEREENESTVQCVFCVKKFKRKQHLQVHLDAVHFAGEKRKCSLCDYATYNKSSLITHIRKRHKETKQTTNAEFECSLCFKKYSKQISLNLHIKRKHNKIEQRKIFIKQCPLCSFVANCAVGRSADNLMYNHFSEVHNINMIIKNLELQSLEEFLLWKKTIEKDNVCIFNRCNRGAKKVYKFTCHRSGYYSSKSKGIRKLKLIGSCKINGFCPAAITAKKKENGNIAVTFVETHIGHENEIQHVYLSETEKQGLASKLAFKIPYDEILNEIRQSVPNKRLNRIHLTTRKDLHNIKKTFNLSDSAIKHKFDPISEEVWANEFSVSSQSVSYSNGSINICEDKERVNPQSMIDPELNFNISCGVSQELTEDKAFEVAKEEFSQHLLYIIRTKVTNDEELKAIRNHCKSIEPILEAMKASSTRTKEDISMQADKTPANCSIIKQKKCLSATKRKTIKKSLTMTKEKEAIASPFIVDDIFQ